MNIDETPLARLGRWSHRSRKKVMVTWLVLAIGLGVLAFLLVWLPKDRASEGWVRLLAWAFVLYVPAAVLVLGVMGMFTSAWILIAALHLVVMAVTYLAMAFFAGLPSPDLRILSLPAQGPAPKVT